MKKKRKARLFVQTCAGLEREARSDDVLETRAGLIVCQHARGTASGRSTRTSRHVPRSATTSAVLVVWPGAEQLFGDLFQNGVLVAKLDYHVCPHATGGGGFDRLCVSHCGCLELNIFFPVLSPKIICSIFAVENQEQPSSRKCHSTSQWSMR